MITVHTKFITTGSYFSSVMKLGYTVFRVALVSVNTEKVTDNICTPYSPTLWPSTRRNL